MHIFLSPGQFERSRLVRSDFSPRWFAAPIMKADQKIRFGSRLSDAIQSVRAGEQRFLVFNVSRTEYIFSQLAPSRLNVISLHQWAPKNGTIDIKHKLRGHVLRRSKLVVTYSRQSYRELSCHFPANRLRWIGHFVDTQFFDPGLQSRDEERFALPAHPYLLAVGDHKRLESMLVQISRRLDLPLVRVTSDPKVVAWYQETRPKGVEVQHRISFTRLRELYREASLVLNAVDDTGWPVGITSFCESLAMGAPIVTSGNHSCSGYSDDLDQVPFGTVVDIYSEEAWLTACRFWLENRAHSVCMRAIAERLCSYESMSQQWSDILGISQS